MQLHTSSRLVRDPAQKTSSNGRSYVNALMTASSGDGEALITLMVFDTDLANLLATLKKGDSLSAIGSASIRAYADKEGKPAAGVTLMVNRLMAMTAKEVAPRPKTARHPADRQQSRRTGEFMYRQARVSSRLIRSKTACHFDRGHHHAKTHSCT